MRTTRAFLAGFGTTGSLLAAAACLFVVASAVVAFRGWPVSHGGSDAAQVVRNDARVPWEVPATRQVGIDAQAAAASVAAAPRGPVATGRSVAARGGTAI